MTDGAAVVGAAVVGAAVVGALVIGAAVVGALVRVGVGAAVGAGVVGGRVVGAAVAATTRTVPVMVGWMPQRYANVPALANTIVLVCPGSKTPGAVAVCWTGSRSSSSPNRPDSP